MPLIGCASHKLNLTVKLWIQNETELFGIIAKVSLIMKKADTLAKACCKSSCTHILLLCTRKCHQMVIHISNDLTISDDPSRAHISCGAPANVSYTC